MKNLIYALGATFLIGSSAVSAQSHVRLSTTGEVDVAGITITAEEQVRENFLDLRPALLPSYAHTQVGVSKEFFEYFTLGAGARNVSESGEVSNRLQLDAGAGVDYEGLFVSTGLSLQEVIGADLSEHSLDSFAIRNKATMGYTLPDMYNVRLGIHLSEEHFLTTSGFSENRVTLGSTVTLYEDYSIVGEYFLQTTGEIVNTSLGIGDIENSHVAALNLKASF